MKWIVPFAVAAAPLVAQQKIPEIRFESIRDYFQYPAEMNLGELSGVAVNSKGHVFMISRSNTSGPIWNGIATLWAT